MYRKLLSTSILNTLTAAINFLSSYLIVKTLSLTIFGEFAIFSSYLAFGGLIYSVIPANFSIFKLQDNQEYKVKLLVFFIISSILFLFFVLLISGLGFISLDILTVYLFGISTYLLGYFDIKFQASGRLLRYFFMLFIIAVLKVATLGLFYYMGYMDNLTDLLWTMTIVQLIVILIYAFEDRQEISFIMKNLNVFPETVFFIKNNFEVFKPYYLNTFLKRLRENVIVLVFSNFTNKDIIGLFTIFVKIASFVFGLSRTLEAFFMNKENIKRYREIFYKKVLYFSVVLQFLFLFIGVIYLKIFTGNYFLLEILIPSLLVYPHVYFLLARSEMLSNYKNKEANISELIYMVVVVIGSFISFYINSNTIYPILITFVLATFGLQLFMILSQSFKVNKKGYV
ncbi:hypothetical protein [Flavobacterium sp. RSSB_23]|uniref:hypothetical protein n=1 Tax=Flavobacterium sp. RSSB_23 TaxID=3447668 RepID=UPI003F365E66